MMQTYSARSFFSERMASFFLLSFGLLFLAHAAAGHQSSDHSLMFGAPGDGVTLPCRILSITSCDSVGWRISHSGKEVVKAGRVTDPYINRLGLLEDCSLRIHHLEIDDAQLYSCESGVLNSSVSLRILEISRNPSYSVGKIELHCFLNTHTGYKPCKNEGMNITWTTEDNTALNGNRFHFENIPGCFSKLFIDYKLTDHHRKWRCQMSLNDTVKAATTYTTTVKDGLEEVFAAVSESVSLSCGNTSSLAVGGRVEWRMGSQKDHKSPNKSLTEAFHVNKDFSLGIDKVSPLHVGDYTCSAGQQVFNRVRLHTLDVASESGPGGGNLTLTCILSCSHECVQEFSLTWSGSGLQSALMTINNTLIKKLFVPSMPMASDDFICSVYREGGVMASKRWHIGYSLQTETWFWVTFTLSLLVCISAGGLYMYIKRKHKKDSENELTSIGMNHMYEDIEDDTNDEQHQQRNAKREVATTDSFYDLLQAVN
ncbi:uncharacterized protein LOC121513035 [Cheilinus undulatus]|uniref:uncharacterized protein LOC121513035 n=1 Tax=Cheilinus undulatus TaxID=241271 RepID=UPI001BD6490C|nr:uncharacterized protein LOC121513035 [Cheilinus undulatus]